GRYGAAPRSKGRGHDTDPLHGRGERGRAAAPQTTRPWGPTSGPSEKANPIAETQERLYFLTTSGPRGRILRFPVRDRPARARRRPARSTPTEQHSVMTSPHVLSVGQCAFDHNRISGYLERSFSARVHGVSTFDEAREALRSESYDLVLVNRVNDE